MIKFSICLVFGKNIFLAAIILLDSGILALGIAAEMRLAELQRKARRREAAERPFYSSSAASIDLRRLAAFRSFLFCASDFFCSFGLRGYFVS